jgi:hypothetical protein
MSEPVPAPAIATPIEHMTKAGTLQADRATRALHTVTAAAQLVASGIDPAMIGELSQMQIATIERMRTLRESWSKDWESWWHYAAQLRTSNTMSKLVERETNIFAQMGQLLGSQITDWMGLQENIEVNYAYWLKQKLDQKGLDGAA